MDWNFRFGRSNRPVLPSSNRCWFVNLLSLKSIRRGRGIRRQLSLFGLALLLTLLSAAGSPASFSNRLSWLLLGQISPGVAQSVPAVAVPAVAVPAVGEAVGGDSTHLARSSDSLPEPLSQHNMEPSEQLLIAQNQVDLPHISQAPLAANQGNRIVLNGQTLVGNWMQRDQQLGISDATLMQVMGVDLLNTERFDQQPLQWYSDFADTSLLGSTWFNTGLRYVDVAPLLQRYGWQVQAQGNLLNIQTATAQIAAVRQGRQSWGDRIVIDLDRPAPWQLDELRGEATITVDAIANPQVLSTFATRPGNLLSSLRLSSQSGRTQIALQFPSTARPRIWTLPNPNRLVIDVRSDAMIERNIAWAPGIRWQQKWVTVGAAQFPVTMLALDPQDPHVEIRPIRSNPTAAEGISPLVTMAQSNGAVAAINGGFFNRNNQLPLGVVRDNNRWLSGPILNRGAIAWNEQHQAVVDRLSLIEEIAIANGQRFPITHLNSGYIEAGIARYTPDWGNAYKTLADNEVVVTVQQGQVTNRQSTTTAGQVVPIPQDGYLLVVRSNTAAAQALPIGTTVAQTTRTLPDTLMQSPNLMGGGPLLVKSGRIVLDAPAEQFSTAFVQQAAPRSAIGVVNNQLILVAVHNRVGGAGPTLSEMARLMQQLGATEALNLDGGSSTSLYLGGRLVDRSSQTAARVNNGIGVFLRDVP